MTMNCAPQHERQDDPFRFIRVPTRPSHENSPHAPVRRNFAPWRRTRPGRPAAWPPTAPRSGRSPRPCCGGEPVVITAGDDGEVRLWSLADGELRLSVSTTPPRQVARPPRPDGAGRRRPGPPHRLGGGPISRLDLDTGVEPGRRPSRRHHEDGSGHLAGDRSPTPTARPGSPRRRPTARSGSGATVRASARAHRDHGADPGPVPGLEPGDVAGCAARGASSPAPAAPSCAGSSTTSGSSTTGRSTPPGGHRSR